MSKANTTAVAEQIIQQFLTHNKQIKIVVGVDDFDRETDNDDDEKDDRIDFHYFTEATQENFCNINKISQKFSHINDGVAYILADNTGKLGSSSVETSRFEKSEINKHCEYSFLLDAVKQDKRVILAINEDNEIILKKS